jgi:hypothetical protein
VADAKGIEMMAIVDIENLGVAFRVTPEMVTGKIRIEEFGIPRDINVEHANNLRTHSFIEERPGFKPQEIGWRVIFCSECGVGYFAPAALQNTCSELKMRKALK